MRWLFKLLIPERHLLTPVIVACGLFMQMVDSTVLSTALPSIARALNEDPIHLNLAITAYLITIAVFVPISGWMADRFGARTTFQGAILVFTLSSVACGAANSLTTLVIARIFQGLGGAMMVPVGRLLALRAVPRHDMVRAASYLALPAMIGPLMGPLLGGAIVSYGSWRWIFFINVPIGVLGMVLTALYVPEFKAEHAPRLDVRGAVLAGIAMACLVFGFEVATRASMPLPVALALMAVGLAAAGGYVVHTRKVAQPIIDLSLLKIPTNYAAVVGIAPFMASVSSLAFLLPLMFQIGFGLSPLESGVFTFFGAMGAFVVKAAVRITLKWFGFRRVMTANVFMHALMLALCAVFTPATPHVLILITLFVGGYFRSLNFTATNTLAYADVPSPRMSRATALVGVTQQLAMSFGVGLAAAMLNLTLAMRHETNLGPGDFGPAFLGMAALALWSIWFLLRMPANAGAEVSGHGQAKVAAAE